MLFEIGSAASPANNDAIVLFAHGARDPQWAEPFQKVQRLLRDKLPGTAIELAFLEIMQPNLSDTIKLLVENGQLKITIAPLFMAQGGHLKHDLPLLLESIREQNPLAEIRVLPAIGEVEEILALIAEWVAHACQQ